MKKIFILFILVVLNLKSDEIDKLVKKLKAKRDSNITKNRLITIYSPISQLKIDKKNNILKDSNKKEEILVLKEKRLYKNKKRFILKAIMNDSAYINNRWFKLGDRVGSYILVDIMEDAVFLKDKDKTRLLLINSSRNKKITIIGRAK